MSETTKVVSFRRLTFVIVFRKLLLLILEWGILSRSRNSLLEGCCSILIDQLELLHFIWKWHGISALVGSLAMREAIQEVACVNTPDSESICAMTTRNIINPRPIVDVAIFEIVNSFTMTTTFCRLTLVFIPVFVFDSFVLIKTKIRENLFNLLWC